jgi:predicted O-linked N-acetylglucosamine transferase (SPINDLY family)
MASRASNPGAMHLTLAFQQAMALHQQGRPFQADALCSEVLRVDPKHYGAWHLRALLALEAGDTAQGIQWLERSLKINNRQFAGHSNLGNALLSVGKPREALASLNQALRLKPDYMVALYNRANALRELKRFAEALESYERVLRAQPDDVQALNNKALVLIELGRLAEALDCLEQLLLVSPQDFDAWCGRGNVLLAMKRYEDALRTHTRALEIRPGHVGSLINRGLALRMLHRYAEALSDYDEALRQAPDSVLALTNRGNVLLATGQNEAALAHYEKALGLAPGTPDSLYNRGAALRELHRYSESAQSFAALLKIDPEHAYALGNLFHLRMDSCDWSDYRDLTSRLHTALEADQRVINPLSLLLLDEAPQIQLSCARAYMEEKHPQQAVSAAVVEQSTKIRVAYISADFREHPVSYLLAGTLEKHDRTHFEILGISLRAAEDTELGRRVRAACDQFIEVADRSDPEVAGLLREMGVDVAVDLMGLTQGMRMGIFAHRAAPVQVNYLGYAGTLGAPYMDYVLADGVVIPRGEERWYSEKVVRLPHCYLPNDDLRQIAAAPTRTQAGLPAEGVVLCAFTNAYKINPPVFDIWMRLLREVPQSVLWLRTVGPEVRGNLLREAESRGVDPQRIVFAPHVASMAEHLGRHQLADLYLDTLPYNAHSTTCDALWAGVPVITCAGGSFASRVATSALEAIGLPELIGGSLEEYGRLALELACDARKRQQLRVRLAQNRITMPLFDTAGYTRGLESAYRLMHQRSRQTLAPEAFDVAVD